jgi:hypothetical protein
LVVEDELACPEAELISDQPDRLVTNGDVMSVAAYVLVMAGVLAVLGCAQKVAERL